MPFPQKSGLFMGRLPSMVFPRKGQTVKFIKYFGKGNTVNKTVLLKKGENTVELVRKIEYLFFGGKGEYWIIDFIPQKPVGMEEKPTGKDNLYPIVVGGLKNVEQTIFDIA
jgi:hypothetical protein